MNKVLGILIVSVITFSACAQIKMQKSDGGLIFTENSKNVLFYQIEPKNKDGEYERCNYIHPLWGVDGTVITEDFPADHLHHRGVFWAWHQLWIGDQQIGDPWALIDFEQNVTKVDFVTIGSLGILKTEVEWKSDKWKKQGEKVPYLKENTTIAIHPQKDNYRKIDFVISLLALEENLKIGGSENEKGYSGFSVRMVLPEDIVFTGPAGDVKPETLAVKSEGYINISGSLLDGNKNGGVVIIDNPDNPGYPQNWILRKQKSMQNPAYPGRHAIPISTTKPLILKYSLVVYSGELSDEKIQKIAGIQ